MRSRIKINHCPFGTYLGWTPVVAANAGQPADRQGDWRRSPRPRLRGDDRASFPYWARLNEDKIRACVDGDTRAARIRVLSTLAVRKFTNLRRSVDLSLAALALLALAAVGLAL
ncbi:hypothetical protein [Streptomyces paradoxus]|uniref:hypothetical protein n=1 Tax=Streptomyces paradoxus TaxID=66375 RepID=UPI00382D5785